MKIFIKIILVICCLSLGPLGILLFLVIKKRNKVGIPLTREHLWSLILFGVLVALAAMGFFGLPNIIGPIATYLYVIGMFCVWLGFGFGAYNTQHIRGAACNGIRFSNTLIRGNELYNAIKSELTPALHQTSSQVEITESVMASGGLFKRSLLPMLIIKNVEPGCKYFDIGIIINDDTILFPLLGESKENTKQNLHDLYKKEGTFSGDVKSAFYNPNIFELQKEAAWREKVISCFEQTILEHSEPNP